MQGFLLIHSDALFDSELRHCVQASECTGIWMYLALSVYQLTNMQLPEAKHCQGAQQLLRQLHYVSAEVHGYHGNHQNTPVWISYSTDIWRLPETVSSIIHTGEDHHQNQSSVIHPHVDDTGWWQVGCLNAHTSISFTKLHHFVLTFVFT